ncbi:MAG: hypothetical protein M0C28_27235 [Candidatus Moduliflexus flocculans]|nr:hypothetical protein [Candidatus Moduliflexus flocculans]
MVAGTGPRRHRRLLRRALGPEAGRTSSRSRGPRSRASGMMDLDKVDVREDDTFRNASAAGEARRGELTRPGDPEPPALRRAVPPPERGRRSRTGRRPGPAQGRICRPTVPRPAGRRTGNPRNSRARTSTPTSTAGPRSTRNTGSAA